MGKGIIITTPRPTQQILGQAIVASTDQNDTYNASFPGSVVEFVSGAGEIGDVVECIITSAITCEITSVVGQSILAQGKVTMHEIHRCEFKVEVICDPNPYGVKRDDILQFKDPGQEVKLDDSIGCIPTAVGISQFVRVLQLA